MSKSNFLSGVVGLLTLTIANAQVTTTAKIDGSPYLDEAYVQGQIFYADKSVKMPIRYNIFQDVMEYKQNGRALVLDPTTNIKKVIFGTHTFVVQKFEFKGKTKYGYLAQLDSGKVILFSKKVVNYLAEMKGRALDGGDQPARYNRAPDVFYYKIGDGEVLEVESIKSMIASFPAKQEELTVFAKKEKITPRKEEKIIKLVQYYNSL